MSAFVPAVARIKCSNPVWEPQLPKPKERLCLFVICVIFSSPPSSIGHHPESIFHHCNALKDTRRRTTRWLLQWFLLFLSSRWTKIMQLMLPQHTSWGSSVFFICFFFVCPKLVTLIWALICQNGDLFLGICFFPQSPLLFIKASQQDWLVYLEFTLLPYQML